MHPEVLDKRRREIFNLLKNFSNFYLAGGTALALQIGHRISVDFDFFSTKEISKNLLAKVKKIFVSRDVSISVNNPDELSVFVDDIKLTFLRYPFPVAGKLIDMQGIKLLSITEIAATKAYTIGRRGSYKDYIDLYFILKENHSNLKNIIKLSEKKYKSEFNSRLFLEQLLYLEDAKDEKVILLKEKINRDKLKNFLTKEIAKISL